MSSSGLVLTDYHVVRGDLFIGVRIGGVGVPPPSIVIDDPSDDLALLQIQGGGAVTPGVETSRPPPPSAIGKMVIAIGNAQGLEIAPRAAAGRLLALGRTVSTGWARPRSAWRGSSRLPPHLHRGFRGRARQTFREGSSG